MSNINRFPDGLLAFLDLKTRGEVPATLQSQVMPSIDMAPFWELGGSPRNLLVFQSGPVSGTNYGNLGPAVGEVWLVRSAYVLLRSDAIGQAANASLNLNRAVSPSTHVLATTFWAAGTAFQALSEVAATWAPQWPMFLRPGDVLTGRVDTNVIAPGALTVGVSYTPFQA